jgi:hypothetical protein
MNDHRKGHQESETAIPYPLDGGGWVARLGTWAPPAVMLSWTSFLAFAAVFGLQLNGALRAWFRIKLGGGGLEGSRNLTLALAVFAAGLAWVIALRCRHRPGPVGPRLWALGLALAASALAAFQLGFRHWEELAPQADLATAACFAAALALSPRLLRLRPDNPWTQRAAPWSLALLLALLAPGLWLVAGSAAQFQREGFAAAVADMASKARELPGCAEAGGVCGETLYPGGKRRLDSVLEHAQWQESADLLGRADEFAAAKDALLDGLVAEAARRLRRRLAEGAAHWQENGLDEASLDEFKEILHVAARMDRAGQGSAARQAYLGLVDALAAALRDGTAKLGEPPVAYSAETKNGPWPPNPVFPGASRQVIKYHQALGRLYAEAGNIVDGPPPLEALRDAYSRHTGWDQAVQALDNDFGRHWLTRYLGQGQRPPPSLAAVFGMPVIARLKANDINGLLNLARQEAGKALAQSNCEWMPGGTEKNLESLQCRAYSAAAGDGAALRAELRLVYDSASPKPLRLLFFIPVPPGAAKPDFIAEVGNALKEAKKPLKAFLDAANTAPNDQCPPPKNKPAGECANIYPFTGQQEYIRVIAYPNK